MIRSIYTKVLIDYLILLIAGIPSFFWFTYGIWIHGDVLIPLNPSISKFIQDFGSTWNYVTYDLGGPYIWLPRFPYRLFFSLLNQLGLDLSTSERLYFYFVYTLPGLSMYYLANILFSKYSIYRRRIIAITSGLVYMYNPFLFVTFVYLPYGLIPLFLALLIKGIRNPSNIWYVIAFAVVSSLINVTFPTAGIVILAAILMAAFTIYLIVSKEVQHCFFNTLIFFASSSLILFLLNAWWILPYLELKPVFSEELTNVPIPYFVYRNAILIELLRWLGWWPYYTEYYPYTYLYKNNPAFVILSVLPMLFASYTLLSKPRKKEIIFLSLLILFGLFMAKGPNPPFGELVNYLLVNVDLMKFVRETPKFMLIVTLSLSLLIGVACSEFYFRIRKYSLSLSLLFLLLILSLLMINAFPVISGQILFRVNDPENISVTVPDDYFVVSKLIKSIDNNNYITLNFPPIPAYIGYRWGYSGANILPEIFETPLIYGQSFASNPHLRDVIFDPGSYIRLLGLTNIKYIIVDKSMISSSFNTSYVIESLTKHPDVHLVFNSSFLMLFELKSSTPRIYIARCILFTPDSRSAELTTNFLNLTLPVIFDLKEAARLSENLPNIPIYIVLNASNNISDLSSRDKFKKYEILSPISSIFTAYSTNLKNITYIGNFFLSRGSNSVYISGNFTSDSSLLIFVFNGQHYLDYNISLSSRFISPSRYTLNAKILPQSSVFLVFSNTYDPLWEIRVNGTPAAFPHYKTLLGTNAWIINQASGEVNIQIYYRPQSRLQLGLYISLFGLFVFLAYYIWLLALKRNYLERSKRRRYFSRLYGFN